MKTRVFVTLKNGVLDPQGKAIHHALEGLGFAGVNDVRAGRLEGTATSLIYRFKDDVAVRVRAQGIGSRIDIRSISRVGAGDMGGNCRRIGRLTAALNPGA